MREILPTIFFLSAERSDRPLSGDNAKATFQLGKDLNEKSIPHKQVVGYHNGTRETTYLIVGSEHEADVYALACKYQQRAYLKSNGDRNTTLVDLLDDTTTPLGKLRKTTPEQAKRKGFYTFDPDTGEYWVAR